MKALAQILFEISCTQDFQILLSKGHNSKKGHNSDMKIYGSTIIFMRNMYVKFQNSSMHHSKFQKSDSIYEKIYGSTILYVKFQNFSMHHSKVSKKVTN